MASYFNKRWFIYVDCYVYRPACHDINVNKCPEFDECPHVPIDVCPKYTCRQFYFKYTRTFENCAMKMYRIQKVKKELLRDLKKAYDY